MRTITNNRVLSIGIHPRALDYSTLDIDEPTLTARVAAGQAALAAAGFDIVHCLTGTDPDQAEADVRAHLPAGPFGLAMIGAGIRALPQHTLLFERVINTVLAEIPGVRFCFNVSPEDTVNALRRWVQP